MRNNGRKYSLAYSYMEKSRLKDRYVAERSWKPSPSTLEDVRRVKAERQERFREAFLRRQEESLHAHEYEGQYNLGNPDLPAYKHKKEIQDTVSNNQVTIIVGETGSGKSTQIPQFLMEAGYEDITMTQPRILAANGVAERIEDELNLFGGMGRYDANQSIGVHTSELNTTYGKDVDIKVVTDGLRLAQEYGGRGEVVDEVLIIDEVHEWNANIEVLVATAKKLVSEQSGMRLVIMSATMDSEALSNYFADAVGGIPPIVEIEGRSFPVEKMEKPDSTVVAEVMDNLDESGDILVFVPGKREIEDTIDELNRRLAGTQYKDAVTLPLHSRMPKRSQDMVYMQPEGRKKIVVATGIAQTSITIPGITTVIDAGLERRLEFDEEDKLGLQLHPTAQDACIQRAGRAGRVEPGRYILTRLDEDARFQPFISRREESIPEIMRTNLARNVLRTACDGQDFAELDLFHPVEQDRIRDAKETLHALGALEVTSEDDDSVTEVGHYMDRFSVDVGLARMMAEARDKSENVRRYMAAIVSSVEAGNLQSFASGTDEKNWQKLVLDEKDSDLLAQLKIFSEVYNQGFTSEYESDVDFYDYIESFDLDAKNVRRALSQYSKNASRADVPSDLIAQEIAPPTTKELDEIYQCIYAGMADSVYRKAGREGRESVYEEVGGRNSIPRFISNRSVVEKPGEFVVGSAYHHESYVDGEKKLRSIVENVTKVGSPLDLATSALRRFVTEKPIDYTWRDGQLKQVSELKFWGQSLGVSTEKTPEYSREVGEQVLSEVLRSGRRLPTVSKMMELRDATIEVAHKDRLQKVAPLTQDFIRDTIREVIERGRYNTIQEVENDLIVLDNLESRFSLDKYIDVETLERIASESPDSIEVYEGVIPLMYRDGAPLAKSRVDFIDREVYLDDGREVLFPVPGLKQRGRKTYRYVSGSKLNNN